jgi:hypothetical protein
VKIPNVDYCTHLHLYTRVSVSVLEQLPRPLLRDSLNVKFLSIQYQYRDLVPILRPRNTNIETASIFVQGVRVMISYIETASIFVQGVRVMISSLRISRPLPLYRYRDPSVLMLSGVHRNIIWLLGVHGAKRFKKPCSRWTEHNC